ncbi:hypothetical protein [Clostridium algidicarnis]|uniref:Uncharacterized protein n=2 Tax=Clostridium algidicarnis TaxID=37659 RepID=A0A2S6FW46_9CLOT|nr:hypothetical protein [Clostridium algidicarnis]MBB6631086.1 hypothetical protein [Clostridium algidicarnis]MBB6696608.1 hypothetical protein [Clostridium algidicarnis]MBU3194305.1 hypothetical protein [Clostridium algidicarnis]MBU3207443.1 hypothetical protein [Clostridium algidicarnis]MBU3220711.1 hypothetical protein [Clostridium algidicarnis]
MKKILAIVGVVCVFLIGFLIFESKTNSYNQAQFDNGIEDHLFGRNLVLDAKVDEFPDLNSVEDNTDIIVVGKKINQEEPTIIYNQEGRIDISYTLSNFLIEKVISGNSFTSGTEIIILENAAYNKKENLTYNIAGYELMKTNNDYLLFLKKSETDPYYLITGVNYGKVPLQNEGNGLKKSLKNANSDYANEVLSEFDHQNSIREEALKKYAPSLK